jgi:hypothetical protein
MQGLKYFSAHYLSSLKKPSTQDEYLTMVLGFSCFSGAYCLAASRGHRYDITGIFYDGQEVVILI